MLVGAAELVAAIRQVCNLPARSIVHEHLRLQALVLLGRADDANDVPRTPPLIVRLLVLIPGTVFFGLDDQEVVGTELVSALAVEGFGEAPRGAWG